MSHLVVQQFTELIEKLRNLEDGVIKNSSDPLIASEISREVIQDLRNRLTIKRNEFVESIKNARLTHNDYKEVMNEINENLSRWLRLLQGKYGRKSRMLMEYGILPLKPYRNRVKKEPSATPPSNTVQN
jgi:hypothetical protein